MPELNKQKYKEHLIDMYRSQGKPIPTERNLFAMCEIMDVLFSHGGECSVQDIYNHFGIKKEG